MPRETVSVGHPEGPAFFPAGRGIWRAAFELAAHRFAPKIILGDVLNVYESSLTFTSAISRLR